MGIYPTSDIPSPFLFEKIIKKTSILIELDKFSNILKKYFAIAAALVESSESFALNWRHTVPIVNEIAQVDPRFSRSNVAREQVAFTGLEPDTA